MNLRYFTAAAIGALIYGVLLHSFFEFSEFGQWLALTLSVGGFVVCVYNYLRWVEKLINGEITLDLMDVLNGIPR